MGGGDVESESMAKLLGNQKLKSVFVGGKGGVGKTTCSSSLALRFALERPDKKILLISTDPAHNVSDAFMQNFSGEPMLVEGTANGNLYACEVDPDVTLEKDIEQIKEAAGQKETTEEMDQFISEFREWVMSVPGIDEAMAMSTVLDHMESGTYDLLVFDTAPTGHTIRLLQLPTVLKVGLEKLQSWKARLSGIFGSVAAYMYKDSSAAAQARAMKSIEEKIKTYHDAVTKISNMFKNNTQTEFVCVANATFLSVYETKRLVNELKASGIKCTNVIVNMLMPRAFSKVTPEDGGANVIYKALAETCGMNPDIALAVKDAVELCGGISRIQEKYLSILREDESALNITLLPLLNGEVRGVSNLASFSERLLTPDPKLSFDPKIQTNKFNPLANLDLAQNASSYVAHTDAKFMNKTSAMEDGMEVDDDEVIEGIEIGDTVEIFGLKKAPQHNGLRGQVKSVKQERYEVRLGSGKRPLLIKEANLRRIRADTRESADTGTANDPASAPRAEAVTPEIIATVQGLLMRPNGIQTLLEHPLVAELKQTDDKVKGFFDDIEGNGIFAGLKYLSDNHIMSKLAAVVTEIKQEEDAKAT